MSDFLHQTNTAKKYCKIKFLFLKLVFEKILIILGCSILIRWNNKVNKHIEYNIL